MPEYVNPLGRLAEDGVARPEHLIGRLPSEERRRQSAYAVIECFQEIPCDPCVTSCRFEAIRPFEDINDLPFVIFDNCNACGVCASKCPGLAIFIIDESKSEDVATIRMPYEYSPLPVKGETVMALNRTGDDVVEVPVLQVSGGKNLTTPLVTIEIPKALIFDVRALRRLDDDERAAKEADEAVTAPPDDLSTIVCRCEGVTLGEIRARIAAGARSIDEIKHRTRSGMGPCQGRSCRQIILAEIARAEGVSPNELAEGCFRPPLRPVALGLLAEQEDSHAENG